MLRNGFWLALGMGWVLASGGCSMCPQPAEDYAYAAYGGLIQRADRMQGRVGSAFTPAEGAPHPLEPGAPFGDPTLPAPYYAAGEGAEAPKTADASQSQPTETAFDPGDLFSSSPK